MTFIAFVIVAILVGMAAQIDKGRLGVGWGALTLVFELVAWMFGNFAIAGDPGLASDPNAPIYSAILAGMLGGGLGIIIVATLPKVPRPSKN